MSLYDVMSHSGLAIYAEVALVIFFVVFVGVMLWTWLPSRREELEQTGRLPLDDDGPEPRERKAGA